MTQTRRETDEKPTAFKAFEPVLSRWTTEDLEQAAEDVQGLVDHPGYKVLHRVIGEKKDWLLKRLIYGENVSHQTYVAQTSMSSGLDQVLRVAECVQFMAERREEEEAEAARQALKREQERAA